MGSLDIEWDVYEEKQDNVKGIVSGKSLGKIKTRTMIAPGMTIVVNKRKRRIRCLNLFENKKTIFVERQKGG